MASRTLTWQDPAGHWKVEGISVDGQPLIRIWHDTVSYRGELLLHEDLEPGWYPRSGASRTRLGPVYGPGGWILAYDVPWPGDVMGFADFNEFIRQFTARLAEPVKEVA